MEKRSATKWSWHEMISFQKQDKKNNMQINANLEFQMFLQNIRFNLNFQYK